MAFGLDADSLRAQRLPLVVSSGRTLVLVSTFGASDRAAEDRVLRDAVTSCRRSVPFTPADSAAYVGISPPEFDLVPATGQAFLVLTILPEDGSAALCRVSESARLLAALRGTVITSDSSAPSNRVIEAVSVRLDSTPVEVRASAARPLRRLGPSGLMPPALRWYRVVIDLSSLESQLSGDAPQLTVDITVGSGGAPDRVRIPRHVIERAWRVAAVERAARDDLKGAAPVRFRTPNDSVLARAMRHYEDGRLGLASASAMRMIDLQQLERSDRRLGYAMTGVALLSAGDTLGATLVLSELVEREPCFAFGDEASADLRARVASLPRPRARCEAMTPLRTAVRAALLPGFARPLDGRSTQDRAQMGVALIGATVGGFLLQSHSRSLYDEYLAFQVSMVGGDTESEFNRAFDGAMNARANGRALWTAAAVLYGAQIVHAVWHERRFAVRLDELRRDGQAPRVSVAPWTDGRTFGFQLRIQ